MLFPIKQGLFKYELEDHYAILGLPLDADSQQIRARYFKIAFRLHPDTCKAPSGQERLLANQIFSKLVNPAYDLLSKDKKRAEFQLVLTQIGKNLAQDADNLSLVSDRAKQLGQATQNRDLMYHRLILPLLTQQYENLDGFFEITAQMSELNLAYLLVKQERIINPQARQSPKTQTPSSSLASGQSNQPQNVKNEEKSLAEKIVMTPMENALKRAREQMERKNYSQVVAELQEVLKRHPNNSTGHALLGMAYLRTNQLTMAKVHIKKAIAVDPTDLTAKQAKQILNKISPEGTDSSSDREKGGLFGKFFGNTKK